jgi:alkaline phosphatase
MGNAILKKNTHSSTIILALFTPNNEVTTMKKALSILFTLPLAMGAFAPVTGAQSDPVARNVILLIGDGMGINQVRIAEIYAGEMWNESLAISTIPYRAVTTTTSASSQVTDSAAASSALQSGYTFNNKAINILPDGAAAYTLGQAAKAAGKSVGVVTTTSLTDATPACVFAHVPDRSQQSEIAVQMPRLARWP